ncbi:addiction module toxin, RelE/StbE family [Marinospirillum celere]|uniref:Addiction module toxin, RelE/StbE family n=1 Tax=Marinospirillum celere TaxID=1122252 RepID=A0A1I1EAX3_9GAMM|nr:type II toxin-antitoxin system RelE/ParE family toxin [Marinospirillum celere]SFB84294.1 addiction module toxin, RelE/StbE family [Marinospirillum celere]
MEILWTDTAKEDRLQIWNYLSEINPQAAEDMDSRFSRSVSVLKQFPESGVPGLIKDTRELYPHPSYRLVYEIHSGKIWILAIVHTAKLWPPLM